MLLRVTFPDAKEHGEQDPGRYAITFQSDCPLGRKCPISFGRHLCVIAVTEKAFHVPLLVVHAVLGMRHVIRPVAPDAMFDLL